MNNINGFGNLNNYSLNSNRQTPQKINTSSEEKSYLPDDVKGNFNNHSDSAQYGWSEPRKGHHWDGSWWNTFKGGGPIAVARRAYDTVVGWFE